MSWALLLLVTALWLLALRAAARERMLANQADAETRRLRTALQEIAEEGCGCDEGIPYRCPSCRASDELSEMGEIR